MQIAQIVDNSLQLATGNDHFAGGLPEPDTVFAARAYGEKCGLGR
jgi:hypothetical protein